MESKSKKLNIGWSENVKKVNKKKNNNKQTKIKSN